MISPEIAAFVVKEYLLPMFESDGKRLLSKKKKRDKSRGAVEGDEEGKDGTSMIDGVDGDGN